MAAMNDLLITTAGELGLDVDHPAVALVAQHNATPAIFHGDLITAIIDGEAGELSAVGTLVLFGHLVATGRVWSFQGSYGRAAVAMIEDGLLDDDGRILCDSPSVQHALAFEADVDVDLPQPATHVPAADPWTPTDAAPAVSPF